MEVADAGREELEEGFADPAAFEDETDGARSRRTTVCATLVGIVGTVSERSSARGRTRVWEDVEGTTKELTDLVWRGASTRRGGLAGAAVGATLEPDAAWRDDCEESDADDLTDFSFGWVVLAEGWCEAFDAPMSR